MGKKYTINVREYGGMRAITAERVRFESCEDFWFFIHRSITDEKRWTVTEPQTGLAIADMCVSRKSAIERAQSVLARVGEDGLAERVEEILSEQPMANVGMQEVKS